ncbi:MAG: hypothetical protein Q4F56_00435 [Candidatus Saccharibacteria bacterium]|nr:hypothetical protein [Candidatus Saccharibacteria bacterium]
MKHFLMVMAIVVASLVALPVSAISENQKNAIVDHCDLIRNSLKSTQKTDARTRVYLGGYYETILSNYIVPLNVRLVENNLSTAELVENQNKFAEVKTLFANDFVSYQQELEELVSMNCKEDPGGFYGQLDKVRQKRKAVEQDTLRIRNLISEHVKLVNQLKRKM